MQLALMNDPHSKEVSERSYISLTLPPCAFLAPPLPHPTPLTLYHTRSHLVVGSQVTLTVHISCALAASSGMGGGPARHAWAEAVISEPCTRSAGITINLSEWADGREAQAGR